MKLATLILGSSLLFMACNNKADQPAEENEIMPVMYSWKPVLNDSTGRLEMVKDTMSGPNDFETGAVIAYLNSNNPDVQLVLEKTSNDTVFVKIPNAEHLTQQMGSSGPTMYFASVVYNLTEVQGLRFVNFDFTEGDHASPGTYNRDSFKDE